MKLNIPEEKKIFYIITAGAVVVTLFIFLIYFITRKPSETKVSKEETAAVVTDEYGINVDSLDKIEYEVEKGETKSTLLTDLGIPQNLVQQVLDKTADVIAPRDFREGMSYYVYKTKGDSSVIKYLVFQFGVFRSVKIELADPVNVIEKKEEVKTVRRMITSEIKGSLYATLDSLQVASDPLVDKIANEIFATRIDFKKIQAGDSFKIIFDDIQVKGKSINVGKVYAAVINHKKEDYYAFYFEQGTTSGYYDEKGNALKDGFLKSPLKFGRISSRFSYHRLHPVLGYVRPHLGTDYAAPTGTPILSIGNGVVIERAYNKGLGNYVKIKHNSTYTTQYAHMSRFAAGIKRGSVVKRSQIIGYVGSTGLATGPHVDFRFWKNGKLVDHTREKYPITNPLEKKYRTAFAAVKDKLMKELNQVTAVAKP